MTEAELTMLQQELLHAIGPDGDGPDLFRAGLHRSPTQQWKAMRSTGIGSRLSAVRKVFPLTEALVGPEFFTHAAGVFCRQTPASHHDLGRYGGSFPAFLAGFPPAAALAYLADAARLEWAIHVAARHSLPARLTPAQLGAVPADQQANACFVLDPASTLIETPFRVDVLWRAHRSDRLDTLDIEGPRALLVRPGETGPTVRCVTAQEATAWRSFSAGGTLQAACDQMVRDGHREVEAAVGQAIVLRWFVGVGVAGAQA